MFRYVRYVPRLDTRACYVNLSKPSPQVLVTLAPAVWYGMDPEPLDLLRRSLPLPGSRTESQGRVVMLSYQKTRLRCLKAKIDYSKIVRTSSLFLVKQVAAHPAALKPNHINIP